MRPTYLDPKRLSALHADCTLTGVLGIAAKRERTQIDDLISAVFAVVACVGIQPKNVCTQTCCLTGVSCYFICTHTSKLTVLLPWVAEDGTQPRRERTRL